MLEVAKGWGVIQDGQLCGEAYQDQDGAVGHAGLTDGKTVKIVQLRASDWQRIDAVMRLLGDAVPAHDSDECYLRLLACHRAARSIYTGDEQLEIPPAMARAHRVPGVDGVGRCSRCGSSVFRVEGGRDRCSGCGADLGARPFPIAESVPRTDADSVPQTGVKMELPGPGSAADPAQ